MLRRTAFVPSGASADGTGNWAHFQTAEGTRLLKMFRNTLDRDQQRKIVSRLGRHWLDVLPFVPLFAGPQWSTFSTKHFIGFPSRSSFYLQPSFLTSDYVVALTRIRPA